MVVIWITILLLSRKEAYEPAPAPRAAVPLRCAEPDRTRLRPGRPLPALPGEDLSNASGRPRGTRGLLLCRQRSARRGAGHAAGGNHPPIHGASARPTGVGGRRLSPGLEAGTGSGTVAAGVSPDHALQVPRTAASAREGQAR